MELETEVAYIQRKWLKGRKVQKKQSNGIRRNHIAIRKAEIKYEDFDKIELKVAEVVDCQKVKGADKLLQFRLAAGDDQDRQILSGIAEFYPEPQDLIGKKS